MLDRIIANSNDGTSKINLPAITPDMIKKERLVLLQRTYEHAIETVSDNERVKRFLQEMFMQEFPELGRLILDADTKEEQSDREI